jgi:hypothetical protein
MGRDAAVETIPADLLILFHLADEPSPRAHLGRVDWLLCGAVSRLRARGKFCGERGQRVLLAPGGKLRAQRVMVVGLGRRGDAGLTALARLSYDVARATLDLGCGQIALDLPWRAFPQEPRERVRRAFMEGFVAELRRGRSAPADVTVLP